MTDSATGSCFTEPSKSSVFADGEKGSRPFLPRKEGCWQDIEIKLDDTVTIHRDKDGTEHEITMGGDTFVITLFSKHPVKMLIGKD